MPDVDEIKKLIEEQAKLTKELRAANDALLAEGKNTQKEWTEKMQKLQDRLDEIETKLARPPLPGPTPAPATDEAKARKAAFLSYLRFGQQGLTAEEAKLLVPNPDGPAQRKVLTVSADPTGGYLASPEMTQELIKGVVEFSPVRELARIRSTSARSVKIRKRTGTFAAAWIGETGTKAETAGLTYGLEEIPNHELYAYVYISNEDLEDSDFNLESELNMEASEQFGVAEGTAFLSGTGVVKPEGLLTNAAIAAVNSGDANLIKADGLIDLFYTLKDAYARNASWLLKRGTIAAIRKLKDAQGQYLWQPGIGMDQPPLILGRPYREAVDMPAVAANEFPILFGDYRRGYLIVDRLQVVVVRDPFTSAKSGQVEFIFRRRVGGQVINAEAIKKQKIAA